MELIPAHLMLTAARLLTLPGSPSLDCVLCLLMISLPNSIWCSNVECKSLQYNIKNEQVISYCSIVNPPTNTAHYSSSMFLSSLKMCSLWNLTLDIYVMKHVGWVIYSFISGDFAFSALALFVRHQKSILSVKIEWWGLGVVICLELGADCLHMVQLMPLRPQTLSSLASFTLSQ